MRFLPLFLLFLIGEGLILFFAHTYRESRLTMLKDEQLRSIRQTYHAASLPYEDASRLIFDTQIDDPEVLALMARAFHGDEEERNRVRKLLYARLEKAYRSLRSIGLKQFHFHLPDNTSFLRMHRPDKYGDDLTAIRYSVSKANREQVFVKGFEEGRIFNGFRFVFPLFYRGEHVGSVETSISFEGIREHLERIYPGFYYLMLKKEIVARKVFTEERENYRESLLSPRYFHEESDFTRAMSGIRNTMGPQEFKALNELLRPRVRERLAGEAPFTACGETGGKRWMVSFLPIRNVEGKQAGWLAVYRSMPQAQAIYRDFTAGVILWTLVLFFALLLFAQYEKSNRQIRRQKGELETLNRQLEAKVAAEVRQRRDQEQMMVQQSRMAAMGEMVSAIGHQWRQPLNALGLLIQDLEDAQGYGELDETYLKSTVAKSMEQISYMDRTINDFREFYRPSKEARPFPLRKAVESVASLLSAQLRSKDVGWEITGDPEADTTVYGFKNELEQVVDLINNARDAIESRVARGDLAKGEGRVDLQVVVEGEEAVVRVADNGGGLAPEHLERLFTPYFTTKGEQGTGIGLYMSKTIIEKNMEGSLTCRNREDGTEGALFTIRLPRNRKPEVN